ncbi:unnamed protein product [Rhizophagus irregularis]|nr:unnamed protein product [Rhizophagus irregularis]
MYHVCELRRFSSSAILTRGNKAVLSDSELPILFGNRNECPSLVEIEDLSIGYVPFFNILGFLFFRSLKNVNFS